MASRSPPSATTSSRGRCRRRRGLRRSARSSTTRTPAVPQAEFGGVWIIGTPLVAKDLKTIGFDVMSRANNHATDWGLEGMRQTSRVLDEAGIVHAGVGEHRAAARAARFFDTEKGRVA